MNFRVDLKKYLYIISYKFNNYQMEIFMKIAEVSKKYNISIDTLRYYEKIGLLPHINRDKNGNRQYSDYDCLYIDAVKLCREIGFSIDDIREQISLFNEGEHTVVKIKEMFIKQRYILNEKISKLEKIILCIDSRIKNKEITTEDINQ